MGDSAGGVLQHLGLEQYSQLFESEEIDPPILDKLREEQLSRICVRTMGQRMRLLLSAAREALIVTQVDEEDGGGEGEEGEEEVGDDAEEDGVGGEVGDHPHHQQTSPQKAKQTEA